jgi:hypothetical protein
MKSGDCIECDPVIEELEDGIPKKKDNFPKTPKKGFEWYGPKKGEKVEWTNVPSPYKAYKDGF